MNGSKFYVLFIFLFLTIPLFAQRCLPGMTGVRISGGFVDGFEAKENKVAYYGGISFDRYTRKGNRWIWGVEYWQKPVLYKYKSIPVNTFTLDGGHNFLLVSDRSKTFFCSLGFSAMTGYEVINWGESILSDGARISNVGSFVYGGALNVEFESYLSDQVVLFLQIKERMLFNSSIKPFHLQLGVGIKIII